LFSTIRGNRVEALLVEDAGLELVALLEAEVLGAGEVAEVAGAVVGAVVAGVVGAGVLATLEVAAVASWPLGCWSATMATPSTTRPRTASSTPMICSFRLRAGDSGKEGVM